MINIKNIILYSTGCPSCDVLKEKLDAKKITYTLNNSTEDMKKLGIISVPVLSIDGNLLKYKDAVDWVNKQ